MELFDLFADCIMFEDKDGVDNYFVKADKNRIQVWTRPNTVEHSYIFQALDLSKVSKDILSGVWGKLPEALQQKVIDAQDSRIEVLKERLVVARQKRQNKFGSLPKELTCGCGNTMKPNYSVLQKKADALMIPLVDMIKDWKCKICKPVKRGRVAQGGVKMGKVDLVCKCGNGVSYPTNIAEKMASKKGLTLEKMVKGYVCQKCCPTKGKPKKAV
jgi:hypothetical protein